MWCIIGHTTVKKAIIKMSKLRLPVGFCILVLLIVSEVLFLFFVFEKPN